MNKSAKIKIFVSIALVLITALCVAALWRGIVVREYSVESDKVTGEIRAMLITDLHSSIYGKNQKKLVDKINAESPDLILLSGDIADDETPDDGTKQLLAAIGRKYPCFYVTGNHEFWRDETESLKEMIASYGVTVLSGETQIASVGSQQILIGGVDDPDGLASSGDEYLYGEAITPGWNEQLDSVCRQREKESGLFSILLSHRPEKAESYRRSGFDLVVSGHAHGGQVRVPFVMNGLYAPNQGFLPDFAGGLYDLGKTQMIVSRGLCKNSLPRVFNPPELVVINIKPKTVQ